MDVDKVFKILRKDVRKYNVPVVDLIEVQTKDPFKVLLATILSARTKDEVTHQAAKRLYSKVKRFKDFEKLSVRELEKLIYPVGFYKTKARHLKQLSSFNKVPDTIEELVKLPGVGRKTANLVVAVAFGKPAICVDTHVHKTVNRWGYVKTKNPLETEMKLREKLPKKYWKDINRVLVAYGQSVCTPVSPWCSKCVVWSHCKRVGIIKSR